MKVLVYGVATLIVMTAGALYSYSGAAELKPGCTTVSIPVVVDLNDVTAKEVILHARSVVQEGGPRILHVDRAHTDAHRHDAFRGFPSRSGLDRDEYPPASSAEGGAESDIRYIDPRDNRSAGAVMGARLRGFCDGQAFILEPGTP